MDKHSNKYIDASYRLYDVTDGQQELIEETRADQPFTFISGFGILLEDFERQVAELEAGEQFNFTLQPEQAYGAYDDEKVLELEKEVFYVDGRFDAQNVYQDAIIPLQDEEGKRYDGRVVSVTDSMVKVDMNHPLAGRTLKFEGKINISREATAEEIADFMEKVSSPGEGGCGEGGCGCGNGNGNGECCGNGHHHGEGGHHCGHHHHGQGHHCGHHCG